MTNFRAFEQLAWQTMRQHGLNDWTFAWDNARTRGGICRYRRKTITISRIVTELNDDQWFITTLLHEIAHALVGIVDDKHHGPEWRAKFREIGGRGERCHDGKVIRNRRQYA